jgi:uncharacterized membrane protein YdjX (TVP38/TMEM64 family)
VKKSLRASAGDDTAPPGAAHSRGSRRALPWLRIAAIVVVIGLLVAVFHGRIDVDAVHRYAERLNGAVAFGLLVLLPLLGFPASVLHVAAGLRFGVGLGLMLVSLSIGLQLLASYALVHACRDRFAARFERLRRRIPAGAHVSVAIFAVLLPGAPFAAVNYVLPLLGIRLRTYLLCCWPLHTLRSTITVLLGGELAQFSPTRLIVLGAYALVLTAVSAWTYHRLRRQLGYPPAAADDRMQPA